jgi:hypothetical protein
MNTKHNTASIFGIGIAVIAVGIAALVRPAAAQAPLLSHPAQVRQISGDWNHNGQDRDYNHDWDRDSNRGHDRDRDRRRAEQARRDAERARHEAEVRRTQ